MWLRKLLVVISRSVPTVGSTSRTLFGLRNSGSKCEGRSRTLKLASDWLVWNSALWWRHTSNCGISPVHPSFHEVCPAVDAISRTLFRLRSKKSSRLLKLAFDWLVWNSALRWRYVAQATSLYWGHYSLRNPQGFYSRPSSPLYFYHWPAPAYY